MSTRKKVLLYSTLNPYPFWAGSENLWYDFTLDNRVIEKIAFQVMLADSPVTRAKANSLQQAGIGTGFYKHFNIDFARRNLYRLGDKLKRNESPTLPWYREIQKGNYDLVWFNVAALADLASLHYAITLCKKSGIPYWLLLQHGQDHFFCSSQTELEKIREVSLSARRFVFIADKNRQSLERAIGLTLPNAWKTVNAIPAAKIQEARQFIKEPVNQPNTGARFFNLGRFSPADKAQHLLLEALAGSVWKSRDWELEFIGVSGFGKETLADLVHYYGIAPDRVRITEHTTKVFEAIAANDVLLMTSLSEGTPFAMVESMACGKPALGTPVGGIPELIEEGKTGWLCRTTDIADISEKMEQMWKDRLQWGILGKTAAEFVVRYYNQEQSNVQILEKLLGDIG